MRQNKISKDSKTKAAAIVFFLIVFLVWAGITLSKDLKDGITSSHKAHLLFVGDMFFDRQIRTVMQNKGDKFVFACVDDFLGQFDSVIGNLEGPITNYDSVSLGSEVGSPQNYIFTFPSSTAKLLSKNNIKIVSLGNNHIGNFGKEGILQTKKYLDDANVDYFGGINGDEPILRKEISGVPLSFISYNQFGGKSPSEISKDISLERKAGRKVIVFAHWGEEYTGATQNMKRNAKLFAESGASLVIGAHPHVILAQEKSGDAEIFYSLGNFIFDQYWTPEVSTGMGVEVVISENAVETRVHSFEIRRSGETCLQG